MGANGVAGSHNGFYSWSLPKARPLSLDIWECVKTVIGRHPLHISNSHLMQDIGAVTQLPAWKDDAM